MAERLRYQPPATDPDTRKREDAYHELDALVVSLHEHGVLRLARDVSGSLADLTRIAARELDNEAGHRALANLYVLSRLLGRFPAEDFRRVVEAMGDGLNAMGRTPSGDAPYPPGLTGAYELLKDDELWRALGPILEGVKAFTRELRRDDGRAGDDHD